ncbi:SDR family oxidoreductase, partial [Microbacteriaceae bacterium K1510]|nr:SDR family oxidoreductase [Microbacteriaceae bacterium K1510]
SNTFRTGVVGLAKSLASELGPDGILINTVGPGRIATDRVAFLDQMRASTTNATPEQIRKQMEGIIPVGRYGEPEEFARVITFLASPANSYVTGQA